MKSALVIWHVACLDGFTAAWIAESNLSQVMDTELKPAQYGDEIPWDMITEDTQVYLVDFSYKPEQLTQLANGCYGVTVLDHHKSALDMLVDYHHPKVQLILDMNKSGAGICWTFFNGTKPMPDLVAIVQDRDLWRFKYASSKAVTEAMYNRDMTLEEWDKLAETPIEELEAEGKILLAKKERDIAQWITEPMWQSIGGYAAPVLNVPAQYSSDVGHALCNEYSHYPFAATYQDKYVGGGPMRIYSLRSNGFDVQAIAKQYGGGGHIQAAGFKIPLSRVGIDGPMLEERTADIEWESPLEEAQALLVKTQALITKAQEDSDA